MIDKIYVVTDLGPGDGGKGGVVHKLANYCQASAVLKFGGGQGSHGVTTDFGERFNFSHWGCGTLEGISTCITSDFVVIPQAILAEGEALERHGLSDPYEMLTIDPRCICATPYHRYASQLHELLCGNHPRGTVGTGAGEAYRLHKAWGQSNDYPETLTIGEIFRYHEDQWTRPRLQAFSDYYRREFATCKEEEFLPEDWPRAKEILDCLFDDGLLDWTLGEYRRLAQTNIELISTGEFLRIHSGCAVAECSHGVLTDAYRGLAPHTSAIRTLPAMVERSLRSDGFEGKIVRLGVTRAYAVRHGAGPLPTEDTQFGELLPGSCKEENRWQGKVRVGPLDFNLLAYAISCCQAENPEHHFDGICVTWADQVQKNGTWQYCTRYDNFDGKYTTDGLRNVKPVITSVDVSQMNQAELTQLIQDTFNRILNVPVRMISYGPDDKNKILI